MGSQSSALPAGEVRPVGMPLVDRLASGVVTAVPPIMLGIGMWFGWTGNLLRGVRRPGLGRRGGPGDRLGGDTPQAPPVLRR